MTSDMLRSGSEAFCSSVPRWRTLRDLWGVMRYEWSMRGTWTSRAAAIRGTWWWLARRYGCELCEDCGRPGGRMLSSSWRAPDSLWLGVMGSPAGLLCPGCFTRRAGQIGLRLTWAPVVDERSGDA